AQPLADHAAHGEAAESERADAERIRQSNHIAAQTLDGVVAKWNIGASMAACIVTQYPEVREKIASLDIPHPVVAAERMGQYDDRLAVATFKPVEDARVVNIHEWQDALSFPWRRHSCHPRLD